jgi:hypothetical protein
MMEQNKLDPLSLENFQVNSFFAVQTGTFTYLDVGHEPNIANISLG